MMPAPSSKALAAAAAAVCLWAVAPARATVVPRLDLQALTRSSTVIVHGRVLRQWSAWDREHRFIWTHYSLEVTETLKGSPAATVTISEPGGTVGQDALAVAGAPRYKGGEEVVVFLHRTPAGYWRAKGWGQGKYTVERSASGVPRIRAALAGIELASPSGTGAGRQAPSTASPLTRLNGMELGKFKRLVRSHIERPEVTR